VVVVVVMMKMMIMMIIIIITTMIIIILPSLLGATIQVMTADVCGLEHRSALGSAGSSAVMFLALYPIWKAFWSVVYADSKSGLFKQEKSYKHTYSCFVRWNSWLLFTDRMIRSVRNVTCLYLIVWLLLGLLREYL